MGTGCLLKIYPPKDLLESLPKKALENGSHGYSQGMGGSRIEEIDSYTIILRVRLSHL